MYMSKPTGLSLGRKVESTLSSSLTTLYSEIQQVLIHTLTELLDLGV